MTKRELRAKYKKLRSELSFDEVEELSLKIANQSLKLPIWNHENYHVFLSIQEHKEVQSDYLLHILNGKDKNIIVSRSDFKTRRMAHILLTDNTVIRKNEWNIPEPQNGFPVNDELIEVVFIPLLAYDVHGNRVGYGKGFYDIFLSRCSPDTIKIGLSFFEPEPLIGDADTHDIKLDYCITPERTIKFTS